MARGMIPEHLTHRPASWARKQYGCDCSKCLPSGRPAGGKLPMEQLTHGRKSIARRRGCECRVCLPSGKPGSGSAPLEGRDVALTATERSRRLRARKRHQPVPDGVHHGIYAATVYRCKCSTCRAIRQTHNDILRRPWRWGKRRGRYRQRLDRTVKLDVICWPPADAGPDWKCECET